MTNNTLEAVQKRRLNAYARAVVNDIEVMATKHVRAGDSQKSHNRVVKTFDNCLNAECVRSQIQDALEAVIGNKAEDYLI